MNKTKVYDVSNNFKYKDLDNIIVKKKKCQIKKKASYLISKN